MPRELSPVALPLGRALRTLRNERGLTQTELGERAEIHATWVSHLESGRLNPTIGSVFRLAKGLGIKPSELVSRTEEFERRLDDVKAREGGSSLPRA